MVKRRYFKREFKLQILNQIKDKPLAEVAKENDIHPIMIYKWKREFEANPSKAFAGNGNVCKLEAELAQYQQLVGRLYAQNEFLKKASEALKRKILEEKIKQG